MNFNFYNRELSNQNLIGVRDFFLIVVNNIYFFNYINFFLMV